MSLTRVSSAYAARAAEYSDLFGSIDAAAERDRERILAWARSVDGRIIDVGCGPGQWTNYLAEHGADVEGIDPVPEFVAEARRRYPSRRYRIGRADRLDVEDGGLGGVLAWYSLIHTEPGRIDALLAEFARAVRPGGCLAVGFFEGPELAPFGHAVTTAYFWPMDLLASHVERAGFEVIDGDARTDPGTRRLGTLIARRRPDDGY